MKKILIALTVCSSLVSINCFADNLDTTAAKDGAKAVGTDVAKNSPAVTKDAKDATKVAKDANKVTK